MGVYHKGAGRFFGEGILKGEQELEVGFGRISEAGHEGEDGTPFVGMDEEESQNGAVLVLGVTALAPRGLGCAIVVEDALEMNIGAVVFAARDETVRAGEVVFILGMNIRAAIFGAVVYAT